MKFFKKGRTNEKLLIIGLDGVPFELIRDLSDRGVMPACQQIFTSGQLVPMSVSIPEISSVSWSSFMTGKNPGEHGIFGFVDLEDGGYRYRFPSFRDLKAVPFFDSLARFKKRSIIINLPATYPARPIPGVLVSGFVALDLKQAVYPQTYYAYLNSSGYQVDVDAKKGKDKKIEFINELHHTLNVRKKVADYLWQEEYWDLFMFTVTGTDRLHHFLFDAYVDASHPFHQDFLDYYAAVDHIIGDFFERFSHMEGCEMMILSDHGFGAIKKEIYINPILENNGFFKLSGSERSLANISGDTNAFALDPARIFIHQKNKFPQGRVKTKDYHKIRNDIRQLFLNYTVDGEQVIKNIYYKEDIYSNTYISKAADIILEGNPGFDLKGGLKKKSETGISHFTGMHLRDNAFFYSTMPIPDANRMTIYKIKEQIYKVWGL